MKLCQKCMDCILKDVPGANLGQLGDPKGRPVPVPESECEFWAHVRLNNMIAFIDNPLMPEESISLTARDSIKELAKGEKPWTLNYKQLLKESGL